MSAVETLRMLARGERPANGLLHTARLEALGIEAYGEEAIVESFRRAPFDLSDSAAVIAAPGHVAMFDGDTALVADLYGDNIARIWHLYDGDPVEGEPGISVVFDPDLAQARGDVFMAASDHPALAADAAANVLLAGRAIARDELHAYRTRAFAIRAFGTAAHGAALFAVHRLTGAAERTAGFAMAAARWTPDGLQIVCDEAGEASVAERLWTPRIGA